MKQDFGDRVSASRVRDEFAETLNRVAYGGQRVLLHRHGKDLAAIVPVADFELIQKLRGTFQNKNLLQKSTSTDRGKP